MVGAQRTMRILLVRERGARALEVAIALRAVGHAIDSVANAAEALERTGHQRYDLVILDVELPGMDGFGLCRTLRARHMDAPILILTALDDLGHRIEGLDSGADDYMADPFAMAELLARVRALLRRGSLSHAMLIQIRDLEIDVASHEVRRSGRLIQLNAREFAVFGVLARHAGQVLTRDRIIEAVWGAAYVARSNVVETNIRSLRHKLGDDARTGLIETVRGVGYRLRGTDP
jgi:DNA-binding response OmpR family regulator